MMVKIYFRKSNQITFLSVLQDVNGALKTEFIVYLATKKNSLNFFKLLERKHVGGVA
jgi:hypothetical protein